MSEDSETRIQPAEVAQPVGVAGPLIPNPVWNVAVGKWVDDKVRNTPIAAFTETWNHLHSALPHLRDYLEAEFRANKAAP